MLLKSLILAGSVQGLFLILLLNGKEKKSYSDKLLMLWLGIVALQLLFYYSNSPTNAAIPNALQLVGFSLPLISSPIIYFYSSSLAFGSRFKWRKMYAHFIPFILVNLVVFYFNTLKPGNITINNSIPYFSNDVPALIYYSLTLLMAVVPACYILLSLLVLLKYQKLLPENYSYTEKITLNWLKWIVISLLILFVILFPLIKFGVNYGLLNYKNLFVVVGIILSFYIFLVGYFGFRQTGIFSQIPVAEFSENMVDVKASYKNSGLDEETAQLLYQKLKSHMADNTPFLDEDLSLTMLANQLKITPNQLSQVINQKSGANFFYFINSYRVQAVKQKLKDPAFAHYSIIAIGYDCGFRSKSSLNKIFKEMEGQTPSQYQKVY